MAYEGDPEKTEIAVLDSVADFAGATVLEIGAGEGRLLLRYVESAESVVATDPNRAYLAAARTACPAAIREKVSLIQCRGEALPLPDRMFGIALLGWSL